MHSRTQTPLGHVVRAGIRHPLRHRYVESRSSTRRARPRHLLFLRGGGEVEFPLERAALSVA